MYSLPDNCNTVPAIAMGTTVPECDVFTGKGYCIHEAREQEKGWVEHALPLSEMEELSSGDAIAQAAYYASMKPPVKDPPALCASSLCSMTSQPLLL